MSASTSSSSIMAQTHTAGSSVASRPSSTRHSRTGVGRLCSPSNSARMLAVSATMGTGYAQALGCSNVADGAFTHIEYRSYEAVVSAGIVRAARAAAAEGFDALAIGCFYDTALLEAREVSGDMAVTAPCAASLEIAASLANRFGIIVGRRKWHVNCRFEHSGSDASSTYRAAMKRIEDRTVCNFHLLVPSPFVAATSAPPLFAGLRGSGIPVAFHMPVQHQLAAFTFGLGRTIQSSTPYTKSLCTIRPGRASRMYGK